MKEAYLHKSCLTHAPVAILKKIAQKSKRVINTPILLFSLNQNKKDIGQNKIK